MSDALPMLPSRAALAWLRARWRRRHCTHPGLDTARRLPTMREGDHVNVPQAAIEAAAAVHKQIMKDFRGSDAAEEAIAKAVLGAAAPYIATAVAAAERERIRRLAIANGAACTSDEGTGCWFADLIEPAP